MITKIAITDDHPMVLQGITTMLSDTKEIRIVGTYSNASETKENLKEDAPIFCYWISICLISTESNCANN